MDGGDDMLQQMLAGIKKQFPDFSLMDLLGILASGGLGRLQRPQIPRDQQLTVLGGAPPTPATLLPLLASGKYMNIIVLCGAGISVSAGIPDFRSPGSGLYDNLAKYGLERPEQVFDISFFKINPMPFYDLTKTLIPSGGVESIQPTKTHKFIKLLHDKGYLLRCYTQNIDGLERKAGVPGDYVLEAHGHFREAHCCERDCHASFPIEEFKRRIFSGVASDLPINCEKCGDGLVKPDVVFFGEALPPEFAMGVRNDFARCDLLVVMGTSLVVAPFCELVKRVEETVPRLLLNRERVGPWKEWESEDEEEGGEQEKEEEEGTAAGAVAEAGAAAAEADAGGEEASGADATPAEEAEESETKRWNYRDVAMLGDCDDSVVRICEACGWDLESSD